MKGISAEFKAFRQTLISDDLENNPSKESCIKYLRGGLAISDPMRVVCLCAALISTVAAVVFSGGWALVAALCVVGGVFFADISKALRNVIELVGSAQSNRIEHSESERAFIENALRDTSMLCHFKESLLYFAERGDQSV